MAPWPFGRRQKRRPAGRWNLSAPLLRWSPKDTFTIRDSLNGVLVVGATGSGKTSGSGYALADAYLAAGYGGLVLTCKADEREQWQRLAAAAGRSGDVVVFGPESGHVYDFIDDEMQFAGSGAGLTENIVSMIAALAEVSQRGTGGTGGREGERYWEQSSKQLQRNVVDLLALATGKVSIPDMYRVVVSAPVSFEQLRSEQWRGESYCYRLLQQADKQPRTPQQEADFAMVADYFLLELPALSDKTRSVIFSTFTSLVDVLNRGVLRSLFCGETTVTPRVVEDGAILIIDLPIKRYAEIGQLAQVFVKHAFQRSIERRQVNEDTRPVFLWVDEAQFTLTSQDMLFATTCRAARVANVMLTQNLSGIEAALGAGEKGRAEAASLTANLNTKVFHAQADPTTNQWASTLCGRTRQHFVNGSASQSDQEWFAEALGMGGGGQSSGGFSESYEFDVQPSAFSDLRTGGPESGWEVDAIVFRNGKRFAANGRMWLPVTFKQGGRK